MEGHAKISTLPHIGIDQTGKPMMSEILSDDGTPKMIEDAWISYLSTQGVKAGQLTAGFGADETKIGPELTFGIYMQKRLKQPILIIKTAWGGKSINTDFRPPNAGDYPFDQETLNRLREQGKDIDAIQRDKKEATGFYYRKTIDHVKSVLKNIESVYPNYDSAYGYELSGIVWFQGWNDMVDRSTYPARDQPGGYDAYSSATFERIFPLQIALLLSASWAQADPLQVIPKSNKDMQKYIKIFETQWRRRLHMRNSKMKSLLSLPRILGTSS